MSFLTILLVGSIVGLGSTAAWWASGLNMKYSGLTGSLLQGLIVTPLLAVGGVCAFILFAYLVGVPEVPHIGVKGLSDVLAMITAVSIIGGVGLGLTGYLFCKWFD